MFLPRLIVPLFAVGAALSAQTSVPTVQRAVSPQALTPGGAAATLDLATAFTVPGVAGQVVQFDTVLGKFDVGLRPDAAPQEVNNFLTYVRGGQYAKSFFHRSAALDETGAISIVQGGGYVATASGIAAIATNAPVPLEYNLPNARGTIAAARTSDINSATSQWYFNVRDNSSILGASNGGGYTVFGEVLGSGMSVVDAIAALPRVNAGTVFSELPVRNYTSGTVTSDNLVVVNSIAEVPIYPTDTAAGVLSFTVQSSAPSVVSASLSGKTLTLAPGAAGTATITVSATDPNGNVAVATFPVSVTTATPSFTQQPQSATIATGSTVVFRAAADAAASYQWQHDGAAISGATNATLVVTAAQAADAGTYTVVARNPNGATTSAGATLTVKDVAPSDAGRLVNLSIRSNAGTGAKTLIVGFSVGGGTGSTPEPLLIRAVGPSLTPYGVPNVLADPVATLYSGDTVVATNDNWGGDATVLARAHAVQAFDLTSTSSLDAALATSPTPGTYTVQVTGNGGTTGTALAEIYDATTSVTADTPRLLNVSARTNVGTGANVLIAGFAIGGSTARTVLIRASGPALTNFNVTGTLADPKLQLFPYGSQTPMAENDNWGGDPALVSVGDTVKAFPIVDGGSKDAAILITLPPGTYSAQASGADGGTGVALVEVYEVQ